LQTHLNQLFAIELLQQYKTLDGVYENLGLLKDSMAKKLEAGKDLAYLSKKLAAIWTDAPLKLDLAEVDGSKAQPAKITELLNKLEFRSLARQLPEIMQLSEEEARSTGLESSNLKTGQNVLIDTNAKLKDLHLASSDHIYVHSRCAAKHGRKPEVLILSTDGRTTYTLDLKKLDHKAIAPISITRAPAFVLDVIAVLAAAPRGIELCECRCILPELVWRLQRLPRHEGAGRMGRRHVERRGDLPLLGALPHQRGIAARAKRQREGVEQDRFAGAGLTGQHRKARREVDVEPVNQHDVSDREPGQHARFQ